MNYYTNMPLPSKKWTIPVRKWSLTISQLAIFFEGRLNKYLEVEDVTPKKMLPKVTDTKF